MRHLCWELQTCIIALVLFVDTQQLSFSCCDLSRVMYSATNICLDSCTAEHLSSFQLYPMMSISDVSGASVNLLKDNKNIKTHAQNAPYSIRDAGSSLICHGQLELQTVDTASPDNAHLLTRRHPSPQSISCDHHEWNLNSGHRAKRARVENIIKGMIASPGMPCTDVTTNQHEDPDVTPRFNGDGTTNGTESGPTWSDSPDLFPRDAHAGSHSESESSSNRKCQGWNKVRLMNCFQSKPERITLMADVLKYDLSRAVSKSVDSIFKSMLLLQTSPNDSEPNDKGSAGADTSPQASVQDKVRLSCSANVEGQTEALSLVVQKPPLERRAPHRPKPPVAFSYDSRLDEGEQSETNHSTAHQRALGSVQDGPSEVGQVKFETPDAHWNSVKVRSKVNSRCVKSPQTRTVSVDPTLFQRLCLPQIKMESGSLMKNNLYMLNEGLTTNHLKKAKLMFFFTRYPCSQVLKMCFHDVQFTRCITSQLIKWFSNFREFYYIQMEKFARHSLIEGASDVRGLTVGRESELFRALNTHYNKANDFQVPDRFLEVAEITLREFYVAISAGKDREPSWKKAIYKVICKLDSNVPTEFRNHNSG